VQQRTTYRECLAAPLHPSSNTMVDPTIAADFQALAAGVANLQPNAPSQLIFDPFHLNAPFNLSSRAGASTFSDICSPLAES